MWRSKRALAAIVAVPLCASCDPAVFESDSAYVLEDATLLGPGGEELGTLSRSAFPGSSVTLDSHLVIRLFGSYELTSTMSLNWGPPITFVPVTNKFPLNETGEWEKRDDRNVDLIASNDMSVTLVTLEAEDGSRVSQTMPLSKWGSFPYPFDYLNGEKLRLRLVRTSSAVE